MPYQSTAQNQIIWKISIYSLKGFHIHIAFVMVLWFSQFWIIPSPFFVTPQGVRANSLDAGHYRFFKRQLPDANYFWLFLLKEQPKKMEIKFQNYVSQGAIGSQKSLLNLNSWHSLWHEIKSDTGQHSQFLRCLLQINRGQFCGLSQGQDWKVKIGGLGCMKFND